MKTTPFSGPGNKAGGTGPSSGLLSAGDVSLRYGVLPKLGVGGLVLLEGNPGLNEGPGLDDRPGGGPMGPSPPEERPSSRGKSTSFHGFCLCCFSNDGL